MFVKWKAMSSSNIWVNCLLVAIGVCAVLPPSARGLSTVDERESRKLFGGYRITPKFCKPSKTLPSSDPRSKGPTICMFNHECAQRSGEVVGACMDGFLFGACCQILGEIDHSLIQQAQASYLASNHAAAQSYETYGNQQTGSNVHKNSQSYSTSVSPGYGNSPSDNEYTAPTGEFYEASGTDLESDANQGAHYASDSNNLADNNKNNQFYVDSESVVVSSPSSNQYGEYTSSTASPLHQGTHSQSSFSTELPMQMQNGHFPSQYDDDYSQTTPSSTVPTAGGGSHLSTLITNAGSAEFSHSDITHPGADADLVEEDFQFSTGYGPSTAVVPSPQDASATSISVSSSTESQKVVFQKPAFKPKPTAQSVPSQNNNHNYVLVQTISNSRPPSKKPFEGITTSDIESIESIILMLNETKHGPAYNVENSSQGQATYGSSGATHRPSLSTSAMSNDKLNTNGFYITTLEPPVSSGTHKPTTTLSSQTAVHSAITLSSTYQPSTYSVTSTTPSQQNNQNYFSTTTSRPNVVYISSGTTTKVVPLNAKPRPPQENEIIITPTRRQPTRRPTKTPPPRPTNLVTGPTRATIPTPVGRPSTNFGDSNTKKPPSTSYVTGPTTPRPRPSTTSSYLGSTSFSSLSEAYKPTQNAIYTSSYGSSNDYTGSTQKISVQHPTEGHIHPNLPATHPPPSPTVIITPKPTANLATSSVWTQRPGAATSAKVPSTSFIYNPVVTDRPDLDSNSAQFIKVPTVVSNDFDDPGYYGNTATNRPDMNQGTTASFFSVRPTDDRPAFPGYYGPTPTYSTFHLPIASDLTDENEEETNTSPNDFVNFPPVRNPNLNMSATSSAVTYDIELSTPAFVEDEMLKDKMNILVDKIVQSLQGNFDALADIVEERNATFPFGGDSTTKKPASPVKRPQSSLSTKPSTGPNRITTGKPSGTRKPVTPSKKPVSTKKTTVKPSSLDTRKPLGTSTKRPTKQPTRRVPTTSATVENFGADEEVGEETDSADNEVTTEAIRRIECGVRPHVKSGRIVGGKGAVFGEWPWQVLVRESTWLGLFTKNKCGGVLITNKYVITAAHCQPGFLASLVAVFGEFDISGDLESKRSVTKNVKRVIVHRQYDAATFENDLALLELETPIHYDTHIVPICMPSDTADFTGRMATVTGWGRLKYGGGVPSVLQEVQVPIIENSVCQEMFHTAGHQKKILPSFLCAGYANGQKDSCEGDSGGPLVLQREDGRWQLAGTVSHGIKCAAPYLPGVYMRTTYYKPWLKSITGVK